MSIISVWLMKRQNKFKISKWKKKNCNEPWRGRGGVSG